MTTVVSEDRHADEPQIYSDLDSKDKESQPDSGLDDEVEDSETENSQRPFPSTRRTRAESGSRSPANGGTPGGSPAAPPLPPAPAATSPSLSRAVREVIRRAATSTRKRKQPGTGEEGGPSCAGSREHLKGTVQRNGQAAATDLPLNEDSQGSRKIRETLTRPKSDVGVGTANHTSFGLPGGRGWKAARWCSQCPASKPSNAVDV